MFGVAGVLLLEYERLYGELDVLFDRIVIGELDVIGHDIGDEDEVDEVGIVGDESIPG